MKLIKRDTREVFQIIEGSILNIEKAKAKDITGSFLTLKSLDNPEKEEVLYLWPYFADQEYELDLENEQLKLESKNER